MLSTVKFFLLCCMFEVFKIKHWGETLLPYCNLSESRSTGRENEEFQPSVAEKRKPVYVSSMAPIPLLPLNPFWNTPVLNNKQTNPTNPYNNNNGGKKTLVS